MSPEQFQAAALGWIAAFATVALVAIPTFFTVKARFDSLWSAHSENAKAVVELQTVAAVHEDRLNGTMTARIAAGANQAITARAKLLAVARPGVDMVDPPSGK